MKVFYYKDGVRIGPIRGSQLKALALSGDIGPETMVEVKGKTVPARKVKGIEFHPAEVSRPFEVPPLIEPGSSASSADDLVDSSAFLEVSDEPDSRSASKKIEQSAEPAGDSKGSAAYRALLDQSGFLVRFGIFFNLVGFIALIVAIGVGIRVSAQHGTGIGLACVFAIAASAASMFVTGLFFLWLGALGRFLSTVFTADKKD